jgi:hypothetical protein
MLRNSIAVFVTGLALFSTPAPAQEPGGPSDNARYTFQRVQDYFLRLDVRTGQVSQCSWASIGWYCRVLPDERAALESEIARLQNANIALKRELLERGLPLSNGIKPESQVPDRNSILRLPNDFEIEHVSAHVGRVWRRMIEMMANLQRDVLRKS